MARRYSKGLFFDSSNNLKENSGSWYLKCVFIHLCDSSTCFGSIRRKFPLYTKFPSCFSHNIWTLCMFQPLFIAIYRMRRFVSREKFIFWFNIVFAGLIRDFGKIAPSFKFIPSNHLPSMTTIYLRIFKTLSLDVWSDCSIIMFHQSSNQNHTLLNLCN